MKTTKKHFEEYQKWCKHYMAKYGINDWTVYFAHEDLSNAVAQCRTAIIGRGVTFVLATEPNMEPHELDIRARARHEVIHAMIAPLSNLCGSFCSEDEWKQADEALVCRLTNLLDDTH